MLQKALHCGAADVVSLLMTFDSFELKTGFFWLIYPNSAEDDGLCDKHDKFKFLGKTPWPHNNIIPVALAIISILLFQWFISSYFSKCN